MRDQSDATSTGGTEGSSGGDGETVLSEYDYDALAEMIDGFTRQAEHFRRLAFGARQEFLARLLDDGATVFDGKEWQGKVKPGQITHSIKDAIRLRQRLGPFLQVKELKTAFVQPPPPPLRADQRVLNDLHKRGGNIARIIDEERTSIRGDSTLELTRKDGGGGGNRGDREANRCPCPPDTTSAYVAITGSGSHTGITRRANKRRKRTSATASWRFQKGR